MQLDKEGRITLKKSYENEKILGWVFIRDDQVVYYKEEKEEDIIRKYNAWSINKTILAVSDVVEYVTQKAIYRISRSDAYKFGRTYTKYSQGLDDKIVVGISHWEKQYTDPNLNKAIQLFGESWGLELQGFLQQPTLKEISSQVQQDRAVKGVNPSSENVFKAFHQTSFDETKIVLLGNEPDAYEESDGLAYSHSEFLSEIFNVIEAEIYNGFLLDKDTDLSKWASQGILLLNKTLTVRYGEPGSHQNIGWEKFTKYVIETLLKRKTNGVIFFIWENEILDWFERTFENELAKLDVFYSPIQYNNMFNSINLRLKQLGEQEISW